MREGGEYFTTPASAAQRRYEALRAYLLDEMPAAEVADRFGYSTATIRQMATHAAPGPAEPVRRRQARPEGAPQGHRRAAGQGAGAARGRAQRHRDRRRADQGGHAGLGADLLADPRRRGAAPAGPPRRQAAAARLPGSNPVKAAALPGWPAEPVSLPSDHAGLLLLLPAISQIGLPDLIASAGYPSTRELSAWQSIGDAAAGQVRPQAPPLPRGHTGRRRRAWRSPSA